MYMYRNLLSKIQFYGDPSKLRTGDSKPARSCSPRTQNKNMYIAQSPDVVKLLVQVLTIQIMRFYQVINLGSVECVYCS